MKRPKQGDDKPYREWVCKLDCVVPLTCPPSLVTPCDGDVQPSHVALSANEKGTALKSPDRHCVPHCNQHHMEWDGRSHGMFDGWSKELRRQWAAAWVVVTQAQRRDP